MEFLEGATLKYQIASSPRELDTLLSLGIDIAEGLDAAHAKGIVHPPGPLAKGNDHCEADSASW